MSSVFEIPQLSGRHDERLAEKEKRLIHGSSITMIFSPDWDEVVVGWSKKPIEKRGQIWKFPCGEAEVQDVPDMLTANSTELQFTNCAKRECKNETGLDEDKCVFAFVQVLRYVRPSLSRDVGPLQQWHFLALLKERLVLPTEPIESYEMGDPEYWKVVDVLRLPTPNHPIRPERKVNPFHQLALCHCIQELIAIKLHEDPAFLGFRNLLQQLYEEGIGNIKEGELDLAPYMLKLTGMIGRREI
jgi:8-oxo-dGTP pyrophosphatase MutT (NUDIX family)